MINDRTQYVERRTIILRIRLTASEKKIMLDAADNAGCNVSDYARLKMLGNAPKYRKAGPERAALIRGLGELGKLGSNINQIARNLNVAYLKNERIDPRMVEAVTTALQASDMLSHHLIKLIKDGD